MDVSQEHAIGYAKKEMKDYSIYYIKIGFEIKEKKTFMEINIQQNCIAKNDELLRGREGELLGKGTL